MNTALKYTLNNATTFPTSSLFQVCLDKNSQVIHEDKRQLSSDQEAAH